MNKKEAMIANNHKFVPLFGSKQQTFLTSEEEEALFRAYKNELDEKKKKRMLDRIIRVYQPIVRKAVKSLAGYGCEAEDLEQEGNLGLVQAAGRYDLSLGWRFSTFAMPWVSGKMKQFITQNKFLINVCTSHKKKRLFFQLRKMIGIELHRTGAIDMTQEIAEKMAIEFDVSVQDVHNINNLFRSPTLSLNDIVDGGKEKDNVPTTHMDLLEDIRPTPEETLQSIELSDFHKKIVHEAIIRVLNPRESRIFQMQVLSDKSSEQTLENLAHEFSISKERVRQIRNTAMEKIKREIRRETRKMVVEDFFTTTD